MIIERRSLLSTLVAVLLTTMTLAASAGAGTKRRTPPPEKPPDDPPRAVPEVKAAHVLKEFPSYRYPVGHTKRSLVIAPGPSHEALVALAKRLRREDPESSFMIFTDGNAQQCRRYRLWDIHYATDDSARYPSPKEWANHHGIALIHRFGSPRRWKLQVNWGSALVPPVEVDHTVDLE
jgi:hypothetical protein